MKSNGGWGVSRIKAVPICHPDRPNYAKGMCRECYRRSPFMQERRREYYKKNPHLWAEYTRLSKERRTKAAKLYGVALAEQSRMLKEQGDACAICRKKASETRNGLGIDHCHKTGRVRSFLCTRCNTALGMLGDDPALCELAAAYLRHHSLHAEEAAAGRSSLNGQGPIRGARMPSKIR